MDCLTDQRIQQYLDQELNPVENSMIRDHLISCPNCQARYEHYKRIELALQTPRMIDPPAIIEQRVMRRLFPVMPTYSSIFVTLASCLILLISSVYIYFDFANNSLIKAIQITSANTSTWISYLIKSISSIFTWVYSIFKATNTFFEIVLNTSIGIEFISLGFFLFFALCGYLLFLLFFKQQRNTLHEKK
jgi:hypothetical protein